MVPRAARAVCERMAKRRVRAQVLATPAKKRAAPAATRPAAARTGSGGWAWHSPIRRVRGKTPTVAAGKKKADVSSPTSSPRVASRSATARFFSRLAHVIQARKALGVILVHSVPQSEEDIFPEAGQDLGSGSGDSGGFSAQLVAAAADAARGVSSVSATAAGPAFDETPLPLGAHTAKELSHVRCVLVTPRRAHLLEEWSSLVLGDEYERPTFSTGASTPQVLSAYESFFKSFGAAREPSAQFDLLFAFTHALSHLVKSSDDAGEEVGRHERKFLRQLAKAWKQVLALDDVALDVDWQYTRPGVTALLQDFKDEVESSSALARYARGGRALRFSFK